jgi:hypothetical protein
VCVIGKCWFKNSSNGNTLKLRHAVLADRKSFILFNRHHFLSFVSDWTGHLNRSQRCDSPHIMTSWHLPKRSLITAFVNLSTVQVNVPHNKLHVSYKNCYFAFLVNVDISVTNTIKYFVCSSLWISSVLPVTSPSY